MNPARPHRILRYLRACVEAEHAAVELVPLDASPGGAEPALLLERGAVPLGEASAELAQSNRARRWADGRHDADAAESLWVGWPVVRGHRRVGGRRVEIVAGLLIGEVTLAEEGDDEGEDGPVSVLTPRSPSVELGDEALDLLGYPSDERHLLRRDFDRALNRGRGDTFAAAARFLNARGITTASYDPRDLGPIDQAQPLSNTAVAWVGQAADAPSTRFVHEDLARLAGRLDDENPVSPPLAALLADAGREPGDGTGPPPLDPVPGIAPLDVHQEVAIATAMHRPLSVVTAPAGLSRTDLIANTVAAALVRDERVLVASTNERALDLVHERLAAANDWATPVRAGIDPQRPRVADTVDLAIRAKVDPNRTERYPTWWAVRADIDGPYATLGERRALSWRLGQVTRRAAAVEAALPDGVDAQGDTAALAAALGPARTKADEWRAVPRNRPWHRPRVRVAVRGLDQALEAVFVALDGPVGELARLRHDAGDPLAALALATAVLDALQANDEMADLVGQLAKLADESAVDELIENSYAGRSVSAGQLHEDRWADLLDAGSRLRSTVQLYRAGLVVPPSERRGPGTGDDPTADDDGAAAEEETRAELHKLVPDVLGMLPVWLVTTAAVGQWFPLATDLFDLIIVDDAGQGDIASALPALARARRAMVIGDPQQLGPVTHVTTDLDARLAEDHDLSEDDHRRFSPRRGSLLSLASRAAGDASTFLPMVATVDPALVELLGGQWYGGRLQSRDGANGLPPPALRWIDHRGQFDTGRGGRSGRNASEALAVVDEVVAQLAELRTLAEDEPPDESCEETLADDELDSGGGSAESDQEFEAEETARPRRGGLVGSDLDVPTAPARSIGVVTPLVAQRDALSDLLLERFGRAITVDTPDTFQGDERDVVIVSLVIGEDTRRELVELVADDARLNVALSRARSRLLIVGDRAVAAASDTRLAEIARELGA